MNLLQLTQAVKRESGLGDATSVASITTAVGDNRRMFDWVNWAARDITLAREDWRWRRGSATLASTTAQVNDSSDFLLADFASWKKPSGFYRPSSYRLSDGVSSEQELQWLDYDQWRKMFTIGTQAAGRAQYWSVSPNEEFLIGPAPDTAHFIRADYIRDYTDMVADTDVPSIPTRFHMLIVWRALMEYGGFDAAGEVFQRAQSNYSMAWPQLVQSQIEMPGITSRSLA